ncbi:hypothetical protein [Rhodococcoides fascians]|uniref:hypothetical protein n=1 Tax=Rhodococcoides fascians TaxID=1828 RepID=UPI000AAEB3F6|nr:hypothetical protein [Rhodococcus fascians]
MTTTDDLFDATPELSIIRQWARARYAAVWAVFGGVLLRVAATTGPEIQLPGVIGGRASLNLLCAFVAPSGGGKGISDKVARLAWPSPIVERPIGSGEGIAATFMPPKKEGVEPITRAIISVPEIDTLTGVTDRQGSIVLPQLKSAAMGEQLGQANSSEATTRIIPPHSYRLCLSVGAQPTHTKVLFNDTTGGTPQRFLWFPTIDPNMSADVFTDPEPLNARLPFWKPDEDGVVEIVYGPDHIRQTIIDAHIARQRGQQDALDGHAMLTRLKVAAILAILHHRIVVSELDWELSGVVMEMSNGTREWVLGEAKRADRAKVRDRALSRAAGDEFYDQRLLDRVKSSLSNMLGRDGEQSSSELRRRLGKRDKRDLFDQSIAELQHEGIVEQVPGRDRGVRFRISGHGDQLGHPPFPQVNDGDQPGHGDQTTDTHVASATTLHAVSDPPDPPPAQTARQWIDEHVSDLIAAGTTTVESSAVYTAGVDAGFKIDNLRQAVKKSGLISVAARKGGGTVWSLGTGSTNTVVSAEDWLTDWLRSTDGWVKAADVYAAGAAAGYGRDALKSASVRAEISKRGQSIATEWSVAS